MVTIELRFPGGRYHATPWDHSVNEGVVEWPPAPWRILRALIATRFTKSVEEVDETTLQQLIAALAGHLPHYHLPQSSASHLRHYMPGYKPKKILPHSPPKTTKVFDSFLQIAKDQAVYVSWKDLILEPALEHTLDALLKKLTYLGRAESWVDARILPADVPPPVPNVVPLEVGVHVAPHQERVRVLATSLPHTFDAWRARSIEELQAKALDGKRKKAAAAGKAPDKVKLTKGDLTKIDAHLPRSLYEALFADTGDLQRQGWSMAPGARWVDYLRPTDLFLHRTPTLATSPSLPLTILRLGVASTLPPRMTSALDFAYRIRRALQANSGSAMIFSGHAKDGRPLQGHEHIHVFPEARGDHGHITHVTLYAPMGFDDDAQRAVATLCRRGLDERNARHPARLVLLEKGTLEDFGSKISIRNIDTAHGACALFARSATWESLTPFIPTRHPKRRRNGAPKLDDDGLAIGSPEHDLRRLLARAGFPPPRAISPIPHADLDGKTTPWLSFRTHHRHINGRRGGARGYGFRIDFPSEVAGPIACGFAAHLGLGLFGPRAETHESHDTHDAHENERS